MSENSKPGTAKPEPALPSDPPATDQHNDVSLRDLQNLIHKMYYAKDVERGVEGTFMWLMEEVGELASALRSQDRENLAGEVRGRDCLAGHDRQCCGH